MDDGQPFPRRVWSALSASTILVGLGVIALGLAMAFRAVDNARGSTTFDSAAAVLYFGVLPIASIGGGVLALVTVARKRTLRSLLELAIALGLVILLAQTR